VKAHTGLASPNNRGWAYGLHPSNSGLATLLHRSGAAMLHHYGSNAHRLPEAHLLPETVEAGRLITVCGSQLMFAVPSRNRNSCVKCPSTSHHVSTAGSHRCAQIDVCRLNTSRILSIREIDKRTETPSCHNLTRTESSNRLADVSHGERNRRMMTQESVADLTKSIYVNSMPEMRLNECRSFEQRCKL
jgi:hypothetical protein